MRLKLHLNLQFGHSGKMYASVNQGHRTSKVSSNPFNQTYSHLILLKRHNNEGKWWTWTIGPILIIWKECKQNCSCAWHPQKTQGELIFSRLQRLIMLSCLALQNSQMCCTDRCVAQKIFPFCTISVVRNRTWKRTLKKFYSSRFHS